MTVCAIQVLVVGPTAATFGVKALSRRARPHACAGPHVVRGRGSRDAESRSSIEGRGCAMAITRSSRQTSGWVVDGSRRQARWPMQGAAHCTTSAATCCCESTRQRTKPLQTRCSSIRRRKREGGPTPWRREQNDRRKRCALVLTPSTSPNGQKEAGARLLDPVFLGPASQYFGAAGRGQPPSFGAGCSRGYKGGEISQSAWYSWQPEYWWRLMQLAG